MFYLNESLQRIGLAAILVGSIPLIIKASVADHMRRAKAEIDAYRAAQVEAGKAEVEDYRARMEGEAFAKAIHLWRSGELNEALGATIHTLRPTEGERQTKAKCSGA